MKLKWWHVVGIAMGGVATYEITHFVKQDSYRPMINFVAENYPYPLRIAEIGVFHGGNAKRMFENLDVAEIYLIDPYEAYEEYSKERLIFPFLPKSFETVMMNLGEYSARAIPIQLTSEEAAPYVPEDLDMVYIDGNHEYSYVKKDIELYYPKIKQGGIIGGHDILGNPLSDDVQKAVYEFADSHGLTVFIDKPDWWIVV